MPFQQPLSTIIRKADFRGTAFSFPVESVLGSLQGPDKLTIQVSAGYLLTTSINASPEPEQTISYVLQPDGSRVASTTVTVLADGPLLQAGTITLREPSGDVSVLAIDVTADGSLLPVLTISNPELSFEKTDPGEESFAIMKISQHYANTPLTISVDDPDYFSIATGVRQLTFLPSLTFTPSATGTYIHVRYTPDRPGRHIAKLFVEAPYDMKTILLRGRASGLMLPQWGRKPQETDTESDQPIRQVQRLGLPGLLVLGGLAVAGYSYRCQLAPSLCRAKNPAEMPSTDASASLSDTGATANDQKDGRPGLVRPGLVRPGLAQSGQAGPTQAGPDLAVPTVTDPPVTASPLKKEKKRRKERVDWEETEVLTDSADESSSALTSGDQPEPVRQPKSKRRSRSGVTDTTSESNLEKELNKENKDPNN